MARVVKPGGFIYLNAPSNGYVHNHPLDVWRFYPDAGIALEKWAKRNNLSANLIESFVSDRGDEIWCDFVAVFQVDSVNAQPKLYKLVTCRNVNIVDVDSLKLCRLDVNSMTGEIEELATAKAFVKRNEKLVKRANKIRKLLKRI
jgi:hypothetical protein